MNKKLIGMALLLVLAFTVGACNQGGTEGGEGGGEGTPAESPAESPS